jgi:DNA-binding protein HU-beta
MTKQEFVDAVAERSGLTKRDAGAAVDAALGVIETALRNGESVAFTGFGKFQVSRRAERQGVNPRTGARVQIAAANVPKFSAGSRLKLAVNAGGGADSAGGGSETDHGVEYDEDPGVFGADSPGEPDEPWRRRA